jgi:DNA ligase (NAD+)
MYKMQKIDIIFVILYIVILLPYYYNIKTYSLNNYIMQNIQNFKQKGISVLHSLGESDLSAMICYANTQYYNKHSSILTDSEYDIIKDYIERRFPQNTSICEIGAQITKNKAKLPYEMASMNKIKPDTDALPKWMLKFRGPFVISCKLDGVSGMYARLETGVYKLYTRGDGKIGQDISHLIPTLRLPKIAIGDAIRGEFIMPKQVFHAKYKDTFSNSRNLVSGIVNSKSVDSKTADLHFVAYEIIHPILIPSNQIKTLEDLGFETVKYHVMFSISNEILSNILIQWREHYEYEIDGIIVTNDNIYPRKSGNPEHAFAFKMVISNQMAESKVVDVIWTPSKNGILKPRVQIEPIHIGGITIEYATGFNGRFIEDNKIGIGAIISIIRSGDVIPYIKDIVTPSEFAKMPDVPYIWNNTHVDVILENAAEDETVREKNITVFFVSLEVDGLAAGNVKRLMKGGYDTVGKILHMTISDFENIDGFKSKMAEKIYGSIQSKIQNASLIDIMVASNKLGKGLGEKKIRPMMEAFPDILLSSDSKMAKIEKLKTIKGIGNENATEFVSNISSFLEFIEDTGLESKLSGSIGLGPGAPVATSNNGRLSAPEHILTGKKIVMTKIRDKDIIEAMKRYGATLEDTMKRDIFVLIVKSKDDRSNKMEYAEKNGIPIMTAEEFKHSYFT